MLFLSILSLVALVTASPIGSKDYASALRKAARQNVGDLQLSDLAYYSEHSNAAYCNAGAASGAPVTCGGGCPTVESNGVTIVGTFDGFWSGIASYVAVDEERGDIVFSVRGSNNIRNWISNLNFRLVGSDLASGAELHDGFANAWEEMADGVINAVNEAKASHPDYRIVATGHSLGGAVATIGGSYLRKEGHSVDIFSYGAPRVGNGAVSDFITNQEGPEWRVTHTNDPVPRLPPIIFGYRHTSPEYWLSTTSTGPEYPVANIKVCPGNANILCNGGSFGLSILAHLNYLGEMSSCASVFVSSALAADDDEELEARLDGWVQDDIDFVNGQ